MTNSESIWRARHPVFTYQDFGYRFDRTSALVTTFTYQLYQGPQFQHRVIFHDVDQNLFNKQPRELITNLVFHLGLIESFSYWKLAASPEISIACGHLSDEQLAFWHELLINGMGEYFYVNSLDFTTPDFVKFSALLGTPTPSLSAYKNHTARRLGVNLGGGKDSAVMLHLLASHGENFGNFLVEPHSPAASLMAKTTGQPTYQARREFDPKLKDMNQAGYLNGHVPFSASLAFINLLAGVVYDYDYALVGNETSSDEPSLYWLDKPINHQYSKSTKFEQSFINYSRQFLIKNVDYFSFLRVFNELQIAQIFCTIPSYFSITRSCNRGQQQGVWCHHCAKCLFVFLLFSAFLDPEVVCSQIFSENLFNRTDLYSLARELLGLDPVKPLECVGSLDDSRAAFYLALERYQRAGRPLPYLLETLAPAVLATHDNWPAFVHKMLTATADHHFLPAWALDIVRPYCSQNLNTNSTLVETTVHKI